MIAPYFTFGYRFDYVNKLKDFNESPLITSNQFGAGVNLRITPRTHLQLQTDVDQKLASDFNTHIRYRFGLTQSIGKSLAEKNAPSRQGYDLIIAEHNTIIEEQLKRIDSLDRAYVTLENRTSVDTVFIDKTEDGTSAYSASLNSLRKRITEIEKKRGQLISDTVFVEKESTDLKRKYDKLLLAYSDLRAENEKSEAVVWKEITKEEDEKEEIKPSKTEVYAKKETIATAGKNYHIIAMSAKNLVLAEKMAVDLRKSYNSVTILPQPNGYFRVSVYASKYKEVALERLQKVVDEDGRTAWLSHE